MQSTGGDLKVLPLRMVIDWQDDKTSRSRTGGDTITVIWVLGLHVAQRVLDMDAIVKQNN